MSETMTESAPAAKSRPTGGKDSTKCRFCREKIGEVDYKDVSGLHRLLSSQAKIVSRKRSGNCAFHQRSARRAIKRARFIGLLPFVG